MGEVTFKVGYMNAGPQPHPLYSDKMKTWIVATIPRAMFDSVQGNLTGIFSEIMTNLQYGRHSPTLFSKGPADQSSKSVVEFIVNEAAGKIDILLYRPGENVDEQIETYIKNQLKQKIESANGDGDPENVDGGRKRRRKTRKSKKQRSHKSKKTRKH
jgi:hypothetical protein